EGQEASFAATRAVDPSRIQRAVNGMLGPEVVVVRATTAPFTFDARRSATGREYRYRIDTAFVLDPFTARFAWHRPGPLDVEAMRRAAELLIGEHDFASFCRVPKLPASTVRTLRELTVRVRGRHIVINAKADSFLHQMVRSLVGTLVAVGEGKMDPESMPAILDARDRSAAGPIAPPQGLSLVRVTYGAPRGRVRRE
ncbi:MAG TPA: tRNA pseudouridine synthase A, partial [Actinomycetota bacterium]|nr:tRNA pseudouridine synthase A [Actinomycetota bacterium]